MGLVVKDLDEIEGACNAEKVLVLVDLDLADVVARAWIGRETPVIERPQSLEIVVLRSLFEFRAKLVDTFLILGGHLVKVDVTQLVKVRHDLLLLSLATLNWFIVIFPASTFEDRVRIRQ